MLMKVKKYFIDLQQFNNKYRCFFLFFEILYRKTTIFAA